MGPPVKTQQVPIAFSLGGEREEKARDLARFEGISQGSGWEIDGHTEKKGAWQSLASEELQGSGKTSTCSAPFLRT